MAKPKPAGRIPAHETSDTYPRSACEIAGARTLSDYRERQSAPTGPNAPKATKDGRRGAAPAPRKRAVVPTGPTIEDLELELAELKARDQARNAELVDIQQTVAALQQQQQQKQQQKKEK